MNFGSHGSRAHRHIKRKRARGSTHLGPGHQPRRQFGFIDDLVTVALLGQEELAVMGEVHLAGVASDQRVERQAGSSPALGRRIRPSRWASSCRLPNVPGNLDHHVGVRQVDREIADLREDQPTSSPRPEPSVEVLALGVRGLAGDQRKVANRAAIRRSCLRYWPMTRTRSSGRRVARAGAPPGLP